MFETDTPPVLPPLQLLWWRCCQGRGAIHLSNHPCLKLAALAAGVPVSFLEHLAESLNRMIKQWLIGWPKWDQLGKWAA